MEIGGCDSCGNLGIPVGPQGPAGSDGTPGSVWRDGSGVPSNSLGINGDYYLDDNTGNVYHKVSGAYVLIANIKGATGATGATGANGTNGTNGTVWRDGTGAPSSGLGVNGDYYLDDATGNVYLKSAGSYNIVGNIKGPAGATGAAGLSNVFVGTTVFIDSTFGNDGTGTVQNRQTPFLTYAAARTAANSYWNGGGHPAPSAINRILYEWKGNFVLTNSIFLDSFMDHNFNDSIIDLQSGSGLYTIDDNNAACDCIIYGQGQILRTTGGTGGCIITQNSGTALIGSFDYGASSRGIGVLCSNGTQVLTFKNTNGISSSGSNGVSKLGGSQTINGNISSSASQAVLSNAGGVQIINGNISSSVDHGSDCTGGVQTINGNITSYVGVGAYCTSGTQIINNSRIGSVVNADCIQQTGGTQIINNCTLLSSGTGVSITGGSTVLLYGANQTNSAIGTGSAVTLSGTGSLGISSTIV